MSLRISSGIYKGIEIQSPNKGIKPTSEKVRQALMNSLRGELQGALFADFFSGSGAVGFEALSCGAEKVLSIEKNYQFIKIQKNNIKKLSIPENSFQIIKADALKFQPSGDMTGCYDIIFSDPFYEYAIQFQNIIFKSASEMLRNDGRLIFEHSSRDSLIEYSHSLVLEKTKKYGDTTLSVYRKKELRADE